MKKINIIIADDHLMFLEGINTILGDMPEIGEVHLATEGKQVIRLLNQFKVIQKGADGFVPKFTSKEELQKAVRTVLAGEQYFSEIIKQRYMESIFERKKYKNIELSPREKEVLSLLADELTSKEISEKLFISVNTVETHRKNILRLQPVI